jgi:hypothetical protein
MNDEAQITIFVFFAAFCRTDLSDFVSSLLSVKDFYTAVDTDYADYADDENDEIPMTRLCPIQASQPLRRRRRLRHGRMTNG